MAGSGAIRVCGEDDFADILEIINDAAQAYRAVIPADRWHEPYMGAGELAGEIAAGVGFHGLVRKKRLLGVMGIQPVEDVTLIRHAYVRTSAQGGGIGAALLAHLLDSVTTPVLIGTWKAAVWAIAFYEKYGFASVGEEEKERLLRRYWSVPARQIETSVVLADARWRELS
ncbi:MAG: GNAT family N-acetyltransferase [Alphaproteobacteria bacterium]